MPIDYYYKSRMFRINYLLLLGIYMYVRIFSWDS